jgi:hypothetical protein
MAIPQETQDRAVEATGRKYAQDKAVPFVINTKDGRLVPNNVLTRELPDYVLYHGDIKATHEQRMAYLANGHRSRRVVNTAAKEDEVFDVGTADGMALVAFAMDEYGAVLDPTKPIKNLRAEVLRLAKSADAPAATPVAPPKPRGLGAALTEDLAG